MNGIKRSTVSGTSVWELKNLFFFPPNEFEFLIRTLLTLSGPPFKIAKSNLVLHRYDFFTEIHLY